MAVFPIRSEAPNIAALQELQATRQKKSTAPRLEKAPEQEEKGSTKFPTFNAYVNAPSEVSKSKQVRSSEYSDKMPASMAEADKEPKQQTLERMKGGDNPQVDIEARLVSMAKQKSKDGGDTLMSYLRGRIDQVSKMSLEIQDGATPRAVPDQEVPSQAASALNVGGESMDKFTAMHTITNTTQDTTSESYAEVPGISKGTDGPMKDTLVTTNTLGASPEIVDNALAGLNQQINTHSKFTMNGAGEDSISVPSLQNGDSMDIRLNLLEKADALRQQTGFATPSANDTFESMPGLRQNILTADFGDSLNKPNTLGEPSSALSEGLQSKRRHLAGRSNVTLTKAVTSTPKTDAGSDDINIQVELQRSQKAHQEEMRVDFQSTIKDNDSYGGDALMNGSGRNPMAVFMSMYA
jgi:hypothetical protein